MGLPDGRCSRIRPGTVPSSVFHLFRGIPFLQNINFIFYFQYINIHSFRASHKKQILHNHFFIIFNFQFMASKIKLINNLDNKQYSQIVLKISQSIMSILRILTSINGTRFDKLVLFCKYSSILHLIRSHETKAPSSVLQ